MHCMIKLDKFVVGIIITCIIVIIIILHDHSQVSDNCYKILMVMGL